MKRFTVTITLKLNVSAFTEKEAVFGLEKFIKNSLMLFNAQGGDAIMKKNIVVDSAKPVKVEEMLF